MSPDVERRIGELDAAGREQFAFYVRAVGVPKAPDTLSHEALVEAYDNAHADYHRYSVPLSGEHNLAIVTVAAERMLEVKAEIMRRMKR